MKGEYFSWLSHDDVYTSDKLEKQINALSNLENKNTLVCCDYIHIDKDSNVIGSFTQTSSEAKLFSWEEMLIKLFKSRPIHGCALLINKSVFETVGLFDESLRFFQDGFMWYNIFVAKYPVLTIPDVCVMGRIHDKQLTQTGLSVFRRDSEAMSKTIIPQLIGISTKTHNFLLEYAMYNAKHGNGHVVKDVLKQSKGIAVIGLKEKTRIRLMSVYGRIRPMIRKIFYGTIRKTKTA